MNMIPNQLPHYVAVAQKRVVSSGRRMQQMRAIANGLNAAANAVSGANGSGGFP
jgi:hypothetical protein